MSKPGFGPGFSFPSLHWSRWLLLQTHPVLPMSPRVPFAAAVEGVPRLWPSSTIVCLATGPSLTADDVAFCRGKAPVIAINDAYRLAPWANVLYAADAKWWKWHHGVPSFTGLRYSLQKDAAAWNVTVLQDAGYDGLTADPRGLVKGCNSGYQAINLAIHLGASRVVLLGYDMGHAKGQPSHFFGEHPDKAHSPFGLFLAKFETMRHPLRLLGVEVINCSRETALTVFPRHTLTEVFACDALVS